MSDTNKGRRECVLVGHLPITALHFDLANKRKYKTLRHVAEYFYKPNKFAEWF